VSRPAKRLGFDPAPAAHGDAPGRHVQAVGDACPGRYARIEVQDRGGPWHGPSAGPNGHNGLDIIRALASEWNIEGDQLGRTIWVRIGWPARDFG
jgi:hypothetical protein